MKESVNICWIKQWEEKLWICNNIWNTSSCVVILRGIWEGALSACGYKRENSVSVLLRDGNHLWCRNIVGLCWCLGELDLCDWESGMGGGNHELWNPTLLLLLLTSCVIVPDCLWTLIFPPVKWDSNASLPALLWRLEMVYVWHTHLLNKWQLLFWS